MLRKEILTDKNVIIHIDLLQSGKVGEKLLKKYGFW
jgi:hypothetical protein